MSAGTILTRLYPPAVRERWGDAIGDEVAASGVRSWPDTVAGAGRLWLHPSDWPETAPGQTRRVVAVAMFTVIAAATLLLRAVVPLRTLTADVAHPATSAWLALVLLGIGVGAPVPPLRRLAWWRLAGDAVRVLAAPALAVLAMIVVANSGLPDHVPGAAGLALLAWYWATLAFAALRLCTLVGRLVRTAVMPSCARLRAALFLLGTGLALAAAQCALAPGAGGVAPALALAGLGAATVCAGRDLGHDLGHELGHRDRHHGT